MRVGGEKERGEGGREVGEEGINSWETYFFVLIEKTMLMDWT